MIVKVRKIGKTAKDEPHDEWERNVLEADSIKENKTLIGEFEDSFDKEEWTW